MRTICAVCWLLTVPHVNPFRPGNPEVELCGTALPVAAAQFAVRDRRPSVVFSVEIM